MYGSIAGIAEIAKQTFSEKDEPKEGTKSTRKTSRSLPKA